ncbi:hypothetical protein JQC91_15900 [Jannaschia sp. Os4]|uniref:hypothetical protein n=1 Tax=Jannaschia sp. Os4 TaxID=2807617 RepID=UPI00193A2C52|nr:hypothetical protein [Jannaschia sp. Os4]MBM2577791.1 hypothetical protein [Jannaschia sp. Os4]
MADTTFTAEEAMAARRRMREELGMGEERLPPSDLARMIGDEMEKLGDLTRAARIVEEVTGKAVDPAALAPPERG